MSNQSIDGFQGSQPFINDKEYKNLSLDELKKKYGGGSTRKGWFSLATESESESES